MVFVPYSLFGPTLIVMQEEVFQETRRLVIAIIQHITFNEFLPRVLGSETMNKFSLQLHQYGYYSDYSSTCNAAVFNEFSAAVFRQGNLLSFVKVLLIK